MNNLAVLLISLVVIKLNFYLCESVPTTTQLTNGNTTFNNNEESFSIKYQLNDGEIVTKFKWKNILAIETAFKKIDLVQLIKNDRQIIQFWLSNGELVDCEYTNDPNTINQLHKEFHKINPNIHKDVKKYKTLIEEHKNLTILPKHLQRLTEYEKYEQECSQLHKKVKHYFKRKTNSTRKHGRKLRMKRDALVFPGTKWCGKGSNGKEFEDLGDYSFADRCCRDHDRCKYSIGPFERQYYLFNYRFHYVSHCSCDERFRSCLKVANSGAANLVGKIYFNVVKTKCFMFKMDDMCIEHSWWGSCLETKRRKRAVFRDPMTY